MKNLDQRELMLSPSIALCAATFDAGASLHFTPLGLDKAYVTFLKQGWLH